MRLPRVRSHPPGARARGSAPGALLRSFICSSLRKAADSSAPCRARMSASRRASTVGSLMSKITKLSATAWIESTTSSSWTVRSWMSSRSNGATNASSSRRVDLQVELIALLLNRLDLGDPLGQPVEGRDQVLQPHRSRREVSAGCLEQVEELDVLGDQSDCHHALLNVTARGRRRPATRGRP